MADFDRGPLPHGLFDGWAMAPYVDALGRNVGTWEYPSMADEGGNKNDKGREWGQAGKGDTRMGENPTSRQTL